MNDRPVSVCERQFYDGKDVKMRRCTKLIGNQQEINYILNK